MAVEQEERGKRTLAQVVEARASQRSDVLDKDSSWSRMIPRSRIEVHVEKTKVGNSKDKTARSSLSSS